MHEKKKYRADRQLCNPGLIPKGNTLEEMLDCYCKHYRPALSEYLGIFRKFKLEEVIHYATGAVCPCCGKCHPHQRRLCRKDLDRFATNLLALTGLEKAKDFEALYNLISKAKVKGIGPVTLYDSALRISAKLSILPRSVVYLHGHAVIPQMPRKQQMELKRFIPLFAEKGMKAFEIEEFLCCFHDHLAKRKITLTK